MKLIALVLVAALNPLVVRSPEPHGNIPANCETSDAPPMTRISVADAGGGTAAEPEATAPLPPITLKRTTTTATAPSRFDTAAINAAIARNDRAAFDQELARAREAGAPTRVYDDVARLWDAQFESPYFAAGSTPHGIASQYPGYETAVASQVFTDQSGKKFYPAAESRHFVARQAGVQMKTSQASTPRTTTRQADNQPTRKPSNSATQQPSNQKPTQTATKRAATTTSRATSTTLQPRNPATQPSTPAARKSSPPSPSPDPSAAKRSDTAVPAPVVPQVGDTSSTEASPAAGSLPADIAGTVTGADTAATDTAATGTMATDTTATDTAIMPAAETATTDTTASATTTAAPEQGRSIVLPAILILIGLGVLILLFKAR